MQKNAASVAAIRAQLEAMKQEQASQHRKMLSTIAGVLKLFAQEQGNYTSASQRRLPRHARALFSRTEKVRLQPTLESESQQVCRPQMANDEMLFA